MEVLSGVSDGLLWLCFASLKLAAFTLTLSYTKWKRAKLCNSKTSTSPPVSKLVILSLSFLATIPLLLVSDDLSRSMGTLMHIQFVFRVVEIMDDPVYLQDETLFQRYLHCFLPPEMLKHKKTLQELGTTKSKKAISILSELIGYLTFMFVLFQLLQQLESWRVADMPKPWVFSVLYMLRSFSALSMVGKVHQLLFLGLEDSIVEGMMDQPYLATSVREFWGRRWNLYIHYLLKRHIYTPLRFRFKAPQGLAMTAAFFGSAVLHVAHIGAAHISFEAARNQLRFFLLQYAFILAEAFFTSVFGKPPPFLGWLYTMACVTAPVTLFTQGYFEVEFVGGDENGLFSK